MKSLTIFVAMVLFSSCVTSQFLDLNRWRRAPMVGLRSRALGYPQTQPKSGIKGVLFQLQNGNKMFDEVVNRKTNRWFWMLRWSKHWMKIVNIRFSDRSVTLSLTTMLRNIIALATMLLLLLRLRVYLKNIINKSLRSIKRVYYYIV